MPKDKIVIKQHYVTFFFPGVMFSDTSTEKISAWNIDKALDIIKEKEINPYAFYFSTNGRTAKELDSKVIKKSGTYYFGGRVRTLKEVESDNKLDEDILRANMRCNNYDRVITTTRGMTLPIYKEDVVLKVKEETAGNRLTKPPDRVYYR